MTSLSSSFCWQTSNGRVQATLSVPNRQQISTWSVHCMPCGCSIFTCSKTNVFQRVRFRTTRVDGVLLQRACGFLLSCIWGSGIGSEPCVLWLVAALSLENRLVMICIWDRIILGSKSCGNDWAGGAHRLAKPTCIQLDHVLAYRNCFVPRTVSYADHLAFVARVRLCGLAGLAVDVAFLWWANVK